METELRPSNAHTPLPQEVRRRLDVVVRTVQEMSSETDPQALVRLFRRRVDQIFGTSNSISLSRRDLKAPFYRITRSTRWESEINPWKEPDRLPLLSSGMLGELLYGGEPRLFNDVTVPADDPAYSVLEGVRSLLCMPLYDGGTALNMVVRTSDRPGFFAEDDVPDLVLQANLFGKTVNGLVLSQRLQKAYSDLDREMLRVGQIQRALLPSRLPQIPGVDLAASYRTAARAGGDYYDFLPMDDGSWGLMIADVSGHGPPAAVVMAMLRTMLHMQCTERHSPGRVLGELNREMHAQQHVDAGMFVTAFYGVYDPTARTLRFASAGHNPPLLVGRGAHDVLELAHVQALPLAIDNATVYPEHSVTLEAGDMLILYTDGITEATNERREMYGHERLLACVREDIRFAQEIVDCINGRLAAFTSDGAIKDDQTLVAMLVR